MTAVYSEAFATQFNSPPLTSVMANGENWNLTSTPARQAIGIPGWLDIVQDPLGQRGQVLRAAMNDYDPDTAGTAEGVSKRAECNLPEVSFEEYWYAFKVLVMPGDWSALDFSIFQYHKQDAPNAAQPLGILVGNQALSVQVPIAGMMPSTYGSFSVDVIRVAPFAYGVWHDVAFHALLSITATGFRELFLDGARVWRQAGVITAYDDASAGYGKIGVYNLRSNTTPGWGSVRAYFSDLSVRTGAESYATGLNQAMRPPPRLSAQFGRR